MNDNITTHENSLRPISGAENLLASSSKTSGTPEGSFAGVAVKEADSGSELKEWQVRKQELRALHDELSEIISQFLDLGADISRKNEYCNFFEKNTSRLVALGKKIEDVSISASAKRKQNSESEKVDIDAVLNDACVADAAKELCDLHAKFTQKVSPISNLIHEAINNATKYNVRRYEECDSFQNDFRSLVDPATCDGERVNYATFQIKSLFEIIKTCHQKSDEAKRNEQSEDVSHVVDEYENIAFKASHLLDEFLEFAEKTKMQDASQTFYFLRAQSAFKKELEYSLLEIQENENGDSEKAGRAFSAVCSAREAGRVFKKGLEGTSADAKNSYEKSGEDFLAAAKLQIEGETQRLEELQSRAAILSKAGDAYKQASRWLSAVADEFDRSRVPDYLQRADAQKLIGDRYRDLANATSPDAKKAYEKAVKYAESFENENPGTQEGKSLSSAMDAAREAGALFEKSVSETIPPQAQDHYKKAGANFFEAAHELAMKGHSTHTQALLFTANFEKSKGDDFVAEKNRQEEISSQQKKNMQASAQAFREAMTGKMSKIGI